MGNKIKDVSDTLPKLCMNSWHRLPQEQFGPNFTLLTDLCIPKGEAHPFAVVTMLIYRRLSLLYGTNLLKQIYKTAMEDFIHLLYATLYLMQVF